MASDPGTPEEDEKTDPGTPEVDELPEGVEFGDFLGNEYVTGEATSPDDYWNWSLLQGTQFAW